MFAIYVINGVIVILILIMLYALSQLIVSIMNKQTSFMKFIFSMYASLLVACVTFFFIGLLYRGIVFILK